MSVDETVKKTTDTIGDVNSSTEILGDILAGYAVRLEELETEMATLRAELATEVRTRRLVVVDENGAERIHTFINENYAAVTVEWPLIDSDDECMVQLNACNDSSAGLVVMVGGNSAASIVGFDTLDEDGGNQRTSYGDLTLDRQDWIKRDDKWSDAGRHSHLHVEAARRVTLRDGGTVRAQAVMQVPFPQ